MSRPQRLLAGFFVAAGTMHFVVPRAYEAMMPPSLPRRREAVVGSGIAEIAGGLAVIPSGSRLLELRPHRGVRASERSCDRRDEMSRARRSHLHDRHGVAHNLDLLAGPDPVNDGTFWPF